MVRVTDCEAVDAPTVTLPNARLEAESEATGGLKAVPVRVTLWVGVLELSVMAIAAVRVPDAVGAKSPWIAQLPPAAMFAPQLFVNRNDDALAPVTVMLVIERAVPPVLVSVTCCVALVVPTAWLAKVRLVADSVGGGMNPVPLSAILWGELTALSAIVMAAVSAPSAAGAKCPWMVQLAPAATLVPQLFENANEDMSAPVTTMLVMAKGKVPGLVKVTVCVALATPNC